jgi:hypothetical protein
VFGDPKDRQIVGTRLSSFLLTEVLFSSGTGSNFKVLVFYKLSVVSNLTFGVALFFVVVAIGCKQSRPNVPMIAVSEDSAFRKEYDDLLVIIGSSVSGHKMNFDSFVQLDPFLADGVVNAKYKVHAWVYGNEPPPDTIEFTSYDHYSYFGFLKSEYAMLFLRKSKGKYYHEKYLYYDVYKTKTGHWASPRWDIWNFDTLKNGRSMLRKMAYYKPVEYELEVPEDSFYYADEWAELKKIYPEPFYEIENFKATTSYGVVDTALFRLAVEGTLKSRMEFSADNVPREVELVPYVPVKAPELSNEEVNAFSVFFKDFVNAIHNSDTPTLIQLSLPALQVCDSMYGVSFFWRKRIEYLGRRLDLGKYKHYLNEIDYFVHVAKRDIIKSVDSANDKLFDYEGKFLSFGGRGVSTYYSFPIRGYKSEVNDKTLCALHFVRTGGRFLLHSIAFEGMRNCYGAMK